MSRIAVVDLAHPEFGLAPTVRAVPEVDIRVLPHSGTDPETGRFTVAVEGDAAALDEVPQALEADPTVAAFEVLARTTEGAIVQLRHTDAALLVSPTIVAAGGVIWDAHTVGRRWRMHLQVPDREALEALWAYCDDAGISVEIQRLYSQDEWTIGKTPELTDAQRTALVTAYRHGYFEEPREISLEEVAERLDISATAVGGRIRRGVKALIETTLLEA